MTRKARKQFLEILEGEVKRRGISRCCYLIMTRTMKDNIKYLAKRIHPWDYSNQFPNAVKLFTRLCYPRKDRESLWGKDIADRARLIKLNPLGLTPTDPAMIDLITGYLDTLKERPGEWSKRFKQISKYSNLRETVLDKIFTILETGNFSESEIILMKQKIINEGGIEHKESIEMILDTLLLIRTNKKEAS